MIQKISYRKVNLKNIEHYIVQQGISGLRAKKL